MKCFDLIFCQKYIHGELKEKERIEIEKHLSICKKCREIVENMKLEEMELKGLFKEENVDLAPFILERISDIQLEKSAIGRQALYLFLIIFVPFVSSIVLKCFLSIPFIGAFFSPVFYIPSLLFEALNKLLALDFKFLFLEAGMMSILIFVVLLINLRIKTEVLQ